METTPTIGDLVDDTRCSDKSGLGRSGLVLAVVRDSAWVQWPSAPEMPLWAPVFCLKVLS